MFLGKNTLDTYIYIYNYIENGYNFRILANSTQLPFPPTWTVLQ